MSVSTKKNSRDRVLGQAKILKIPRAQSKYTSSTVEAYLENGRKLPIVRNKTASNAKVFLTLTYSLMFLTQNENQKIHKIEK